MPNTKAFYAYADATQPQTDQQSAAQSQLPSQLTIPDQHIQLGIDPSTLVNGEWQVSTQGVSLLTPNQLGSSTSGYVIFGHDWPILLGRMRQSQIGQTVSLRYPNGKVETYKITSVFKVNPTQLDILNMAKPDTVLIYTCSGFLDSQRFVVLAQLQ